jgi:hypothetical protein
VRPTDVLQCAGREVLGSVGPIDFPCLIWEVLIRPRLVSHLEC